MGEDVGEGLQVLVGGVSVIQVTNDARVSTGLTRPDYFNWPGRLHQVLDVAHPPRVVVVMFGANDVQPILTATGPAQVGTAAWFAEYRRRVAETMSILLASGADVYWVGQPLMQDPEFSMRIGQLDAIYAAEARLHPGVTFVDTRPLLANAQGQYSAYLPNSSGQEVQVRTSDGVHLTLAGAERVAALVIAAIRHRWIVPVCTTGSCVP